MDRHIVSVVGAKGLLLEGLKRIVGRSPFHLDKSCSTLTELLETLAEVAPHTNAKRAARIVIVDIDDVGFSHPEAELLRHALPGCMIALLATDQRSVKDPASYSDALIKKDATSAVIVKSLELMALGEPVFPVRRDAYSRPSCVSVPANRNDLCLTPRISTLSKREGEVFSLLMDGSPNKTIARRLGLSESTIKMHVKSILRKTGSKNRTEAALAAKLN